MEGGAEELDIRMCEGMCKNLEKRGIGHPPNKFTR